MRRSGKNIALYLLLVVGLWGFCFVTLKLLFDAFPGSVTINIYRVVWLSLSVALWIWADKKETKKRLLQ